MVYVIVAGLLLLLVPKAWRRLQLSKAKHRSLAGHSKMSRCLAALLPYFSFDNEAFFNCDGADEALTKRRQKHFEELAQQLDALNPTTLTKTQQLQASLSDVNFTKKYRVPFPFRDALPTSFTHTAIVERTSDIMFEDADQHWRYDLFSSYGVNVFGYEFYKSCLLQANEKLKDLGFILGPYHDTVLKNAQRLKVISGLDEVSFHMSGTEAVMQAIRLARYHTRKTHVVRLCGAYHGWWDGVQPGVGNRRNINDVYTLADLSASTLTVLNTRNDIACVIINGMQAMHPNKDAPNDAGLMNSTRQIPYDKARYREWLHRIQAICNKRGIVLIVDEIFTGFRLGKGGAQEFFGIQGDLVTYGKTLGGGLPVGVVCGRAHLMKRYRDHYPADVSLARGTFNSHPMVMATMDIMLDKLEEPETQILYASAETVWNKRVEQLNKKLNDLELPIQLANMHSVLSVCYTKPSMHNWMFQFYLRANGLEPGWVGTGRFIMSLATSDEDWDEIVRRLIKAAFEMNNAGWWDTPEGVTNKDLSKVFSRHLVGALKAHYLPFTRKQAPIIRESMS